MIDQLVITLTLVCGLHNPKVSEKDRLDCIDWHTNCVIGLDSTWTKEHLDSCIQQWKSGARYSDK